MTESAFTLLGTGVSWLELAAFALALGCVALTVLEIHWGWPLAIASSLLYGWLFREHRLYGEAALQLFFALIAAWGWWQWLFGRRRGEGAQPARGLRVAVLGRRGRIALLLAWAASWAGLGLLLERATDSDVPWFDAFPTAGSVLGQILLGRKYLENWLVWLVVDTVSIGLFAYKQLWLTAALYLLFVVLAAAGLLRWRRLLLTSPRVHASGVG